MALSFRYKSVKRPDGTESKTPSIPITLIGVKMNFDSIALIDSGADISAISKDVAELLGIRLDGEINPAFGIGGRVDSLESKMSIIIEKGHEHYPLEIPVKVILGNYDFPILLGRAGFFDEFVISFHQKEERLSLKKTYPTK
ncbi:MAG: hypothetical protein WC438_05015 [Candidatus Pacearchaeota archaeon]